MLGLRVFWWRSVSQSLEYDHSREGYSLFRALLALCRALTSQGCISKASVICGDTEDSKVSQHAADSRGCARDQPLTSWSSSERAGPRGIINSEGFLLCVPLRHCELKTTLPRSTTSVGDTLAPNDRDVQQRRQQREGQSQADVLKEERELLRYRAACHPRSCCIS